MSGRSSKRGFTLAELLAVLVVLSVLAAMLFPTCCPARPAARRSACMSNMKQLASAVAMYTSDYDGAYPQAGLRCPDPTQPDGSPGCPNGALVKNGSGEDGQAGGSRYGYAETWQGGGLKVLVPYTKTSYILWCPSAWRSKVVPTPSDPKGYYAAFEWLERPDRVCYPEAKALLLEAYAYHEERDHRNEVEHPKRHDEPGNPERRVNVAFVDGHVKSMDLSTGCSGNPDPLCVGWESCMGPGGNGNYLCSGAGEGAKARDFP